MQVFNGVMKNILQLVTAGSQGVPPTANGGSSVCIDSLFPNFPSGRLKGCGENYCRRLTSESLFM